MNDNSVIYNMSPEELKEEYEILLQIYSDTLYYLCNKGILAEYIQYINDKLGRTIN